MMRTATRHYPKGYKLLAAEPALGIEIFGDDRAAIAYHGRAGKPDWHYSFASGDRRDRKIADYLAAHREHAARRHPLP